MQTNLPVKMRRRDYWSYGAGVLGISVISQLIGQISYFYTDKVGMAAGLAGSALLITKIADAVTDLIMGQIVDNTKSKWGKARPWLLWMAIPAVLAVLGLLLMPQSLSDTGKFIYAIVSNIFATAVICTAISVPYSCLLNYRTNDQTERTSMNVHRTICNFTIGLFFSIGFIPVTNLLGGTQSAWIKVTLILSLVAAAGMFICFKKTPEYTVQSDNNEKGEAPVPFFEGVRRLFTNRYWVLIALAQLVAHILYGMTGSTTTYYARWIFGSENIVAVMGAIGFAPTLAGFFLITPLVKKFGPVKVVRGAFALGILGALIRILFPYSFAGICTGGALISLSTVPFMMVAMVLVSNVADFEEWRSGQPMVGMVNSASSFGAKVGSGIGSGIIGWVLALFGYAAQATEQSASALQGVLVVSNWIPGILIATLLLIMLAFNLDKKHPHFQEELKARRAAKASAQESYEDPAPESDQGSEQ